MVDGWIEKPLGDVAKVKTGPFGSALHASDYVSVGTPIITVEHLGEYGVVHKNLPLVSQADYQRLSVYILQTGDIVFSRVGSVDRNAYISENENNWLFSGRLLRIRVNSSEINSLYLSYYFKDFRTKNRIYEVAVGQTMASLNTKILNDFYISYPPLPEQRAIATALSDTDAYITALERLIAKKRAIKQGAMQELLTGKRRLPGFSGEWVEKAMSNCLVFEVGYPFKSELFNQNYTGIRLVKNRDLKSDDQVFHTTEEHNQSYIVQNGDVLIGMDGDFIPCLWNKGVALLNQRVGRIKATNIDKRFAYYVLRKPLESLQLGTGATTVKHLSHKDVESLSLCIPSNIDEQTAIAVILSDMDAEIDALTAKLNKARHIKQGMMSELLTGRIRLVETEQNVVQPAAKIIEMPKPAPTQRSGHNQQFDDAVMIAGIVDAFYSDKFRLGRKKVQKLLYFVRRYQDESTAAFKKKAAGPYADVVRYKGGEPIARSNKYIATTTVKGKGTTFAKGNNIPQALDYIRRWNKQADIQWLLDKFLYKSGDDLELLATVDMAICDLTEAGIAVSVESIKHLIATNKEWRDKLNKQVFEDRKIAQAIRDLEELL
ncbi:MAG: restriction endonuclease subunit S [Oscillospiraceae bacterium]|jgi:type I restriction enzyme S subunit|nr:restriction endonuclease subunit S [Oscillospiraceae bacterium]